MISRTSVQTRRLDLIPATSEILRSDLQDKPSLAGHLKASVPGAWPPPSLSEEVLREFIRMDAGGCDPYFTVWYWILDDARRGVRTLIGSGGIVSSQDSEGAVVIGYGVLDDWQGEGYATEAVGALIPVIFETPEISRICAATDPDLPASVRVLEKNGFVAVSRSGGGSGMEEGSLCFERRRD